MWKHLSVQHRLKFQECHVFDILRTSATASQPGSSMSAAEDNYPVIMS